MQKSTKLHTVFWQIITSKWFTLVELLVVITILAIISVVAYQNFWWAVDKAVSGRKISDVSTIEAALQQYKSDNNYYPSVEVFSWVVWTVWSNLWGYSWTVLATKSNTLKVNYNWEEISSLVSGSGWWKVYWVAWLAWYQIWAKWTISRSVMWKKYLSKDLYDPEIWDLKVTWSSTKLIDYWIGKYVYAVYNKWTTVWAWPTNKSWNGYNIAYTMKNGGTETYITKIVWDFDKNTCTTPADCPDTLIWSWSIYLKDWDLQNASWSTNTDQWIPYPVKDFQ